MFAAKGKKSGGKSALSNAIANQIQKKPKTVKPAKPRAAAPAFVAGAGGGTISQFLRAKSQSKVQQKLSLLNRFSTAQKTKQDAETKANQAENATVAPPGEGAAMSNAGQVETVEAVAAPDPKEAVAKAKMTETLQKNVPTSLKQVDEFKEKGKGKEIGDSVKGVVSSDTEGVKSTYQEVENAPPPEPAAAPDVMPEPEAAPAAANPNMGEGVVGETSPQQQDMSEFSKGTDDAVKKEGIEEENLKMVDDGDLGTANKERADLKKQVAEAPSVIQKTEQTEKKAVQQEVQKEEANAKSQIKNKRLNNLKKAQADQKKGKSTLEKKREAVTAQINGIYDQTNRTVKKTLEVLEKRAFKTFDDGQKAATAAFEANVKRRMDEFKADRYSGILGGAKWLKDKLLGMDDLPEVKKIFDEERATFVSTIDNLIKNITAENKRVIQACKQMVADAKKKIAAFVATLGPSLRSAGLAAQKDIQGKLNALDNEINDAQKKLEEGLAIRREAAIKAIDEKIAKMKEAMKGALGKLAGLIFEALMKFFKWALKKAGMDPDALINKVTSTIKAIVKNPKGFFGNLIKAVKGGVFNFRDNIKTHLIKGLIDWITGGLQGAGITLPTTWDLKGIIGLVLQILGLTWANIRRHLVDKMGEKTIAFVEKAIEMGEKALEIFKKIKAGGFGALWDMIKDKAEEIKGMVMDKIKDFISTEVIKAGIVKLVSMLNPVGAIAQAIMGIYNAVMFFVENGSRIAAFVSSIFDSIANIAAGSLGAASAAVEGALAKTIPIIINFIARLAGLGNLGAKVAKVIQAIQKPVNMVLEKLAGIVAKIVKPLLAAGANLLGKAKDKISEWWKKKKQFRTAKGETHTLSFKGNKDNAELTVASTPRSYASFLRLVTIENNDPKKQEKQNAKNNAQTILTEIRELINQSKQATNPADKAKFEDKIMTKLDAMASVTQILFDVVPSDTLDDKRGLPAGFEVRRYLYLNGSNYSASHKDVVSSGKTRIKSLIGTINQPATPVSTKNSIWNELKRKAQVYETNDAPDKKLDTLTGIVPDRIDTYKYDVDHTISLAEDWTKQGFNSSDSHRQGIAGEKHNLRLMLSSYNRQAGGEDEAGTKHQYAKKFYVGKNFESIYNNSPKGSKSIRNIPFIKVP